jgi:hypothetical protein
MIFNAFKSYLEGINGRGLYDEGAFLELLNAPRRSFLAFCKERSLNPSSMGGTIFEWTLNHFLAASLALSLKDEIACVANRQQISYKWKSAGTTKLNLDIVIRNKKSKKLYYAFELKTNFEDGFRKYREEETVLYHHRRKVFPYFRYFYLSLTSPPPAIIAKYKRDLNTLEKRDELYVLNEKEKRYPGVSEFLQTVSSGIQKIDG